MRCESPNQTRSKPTSSATFMHASMWESGKCPGRNMRPKLTIALLAPAREVSAAGILGDDLALLVDDLPAGDRRVGPAARDPALVGAEIDDGVERPEIHLHLTVEIHDDEVGVRADLERALARIEPEEPRGVGGGQLDHALDPEPPASDALREEHGQDHRAAARDAGARRPEVGALDLLRERAVVGAHDVDRPVDEPLPERLDVLDAPERRGY